MNEKIIFRHSSKSLSAINNVKLFEGEKNVDYLEFLISPTYNDINILDCDIKLTYITPDNNEHYLLINKFIQEDTYKDCLRFIINIDENFTSVVGEIKMYLTFLKSDSKDIILKSSPTTIFISEHPYGKEGITEEQLNIIDEVLLRSKEAVDKVEVNRKYLDEMEKKSTDTIENITTVGEARINAINDTAVSQIKAINGTAQAQIESINNVAKQNIETGTNSIVQAAQAQIEGINNVANGQIDAINQKAAVQINAIIGTANTHIDAINKTATSQINAINQTAQAQAQAIELQASEIYGNLGILPGTTTLKTMGVDDYQPKPYSIPRTGNYIRLDSMIINGSEVEFNETNYLRVQLSSNSDGTGLNSSFMITETGKNYSLESYGSDYKYIQLIPYYSSAGLDCTIKYTLIDYDVKAEILALQQALIGVDELIGGDNDE